MITKNALAVLDFDPKGAAKNLIDMGFATIIAQMIQLEIDSVAMVRITSMDTTVEIWSTAIVQLTLFE